MEQQLLRQLYEKYYKEIYLYLYSLGAGREMAEDLCQETFLKALLSLKDGHTNMRAWLYMVARNLYFNENKKRKRETEGDSIGDVEYNNSEDVLERILRDERKRLLYKALQHIEKRKREIILMQYFGNLSLKEIAVILKMTPENVRVSACRGKKELKHYMEEHGYDLS